MNVFEASEERIGKIFNEFDNVYVSFSGGKDSGVLLNLCIDYIRKNLPGRKLGVFHIDYEAQYQMTTDYVDLEFSKNKDIIEPYRICLPVAAKCATSMYSDHWIPWDKKASDLWVRELPKESINEDNHEFGWFVKGIWDYDLQVKFSEWIHEKKKAKRTACLVGIRTDESLNRWRAIHSDKNKNKFKELSWTLKLEKNIYNAYPIYDWKVEDVWIANAKLEWDYNKLYDLFHKAGVPIGKQRVASPFHDSGIENLKLYKVIDPKNWGKMIGRTNGVNFAGLYGGTTAMGWKNIKLPKGHTWKSYMEFLLSTLPKETADGYRKKLAISQEFWRKTGGCLSKDTIKKLKDHKIKFSKGKGTKRHTNKIPITMEYLDDIDIDEFQLIPTYKRMCVCIMKNDHLCKYMGFSLNKTETELRERAEKDFKNTFKEIKKKYKEIKE
jgi:predicted phosphoadenosine phosphosulfate sulfurtransferase